ncbi:MAG: branched-chain amino acid ABC transporter permease [Firmicutes bacterium]|nr:branched-chain amino acid ABC transporter permease [Bacillota bacterium]
MTWKGWAGIAAAVAAACCLPLLTTNAYVIHIGIFLLMYVNLASSLNIVLGLTGQPNFAHATFLGVGAYAAALASLRAGWPFWINLPLGGLVASALGLVIGLPTLRVRGHHLAIVTIGFAQIVRLIEINWDRVTRGPMGLPGIPTASLGSISFGKTEFYYFSLALTLVVLFTIYRLAGSRIGRALMSIRDDEMAAEALGVNTRYYKIYSFVVSTFWAGVSGALYAHYVTFVSPDSFTQADSTSILCMVVVGGAGTLLGPVIGAAVLVVAPEVLRSTSMYRYILVGAVMVVSIMAREGVFSHAFGRLVSALGRDASGGTARGVTRRG